MHNAHTNLLNKTNKNIQNTNIDMYDYYNKKEYPDAPPSSKLNNKKKYVAMR